MEVRQLVPIPYWLYPTKRFRILPGKFMYHCETWKPELFHFQNTVFRQCRRGVAIFVEGSEARQLLVGLQLVGTGNNDHFATVVYHAAPGMNYLGWCADQLRNVDVRIRIAPHTGILFKLDGSGVPYDDDTRLIPFPLDSAHPTSVLSVQSDIQPSLSGLVLQARLTIGFTNLNTLTGEGLLPEELSSTTCSLLRRDILLYKREEDQLFERTPPYVYSCRTTTKNLYVVFGASHANRIAAQLEDLGHVVFNLSVSGWRVSESAVDAMHQSLQNIIYLLPARTVFVYGMLLDNTLYQSESGGQRHLPVRLSDGKYHARGRLTYLSVQEIMGLVETVWKLFLPEGFTHIPGGPIRRIWVGPLERYAVQRCCSNPTHLTNYSEADYRTQLRSYVRRVDECVRSLCTEAQLRMTVVSAADSADENRIPYLFPPHDYRDPVHLKDYMYRRFARYVSRLAETY